MDNRAALLCAFLELNSQILKRNNLGMYCEAIPLACRFRQREVLPEGTGIAQVINLQFLSTARLSDEEIGKPDKQDV